jgi:hypothetical protein
LRINARIRQNGRTMRTNMPDYGDILELLVSIRHVKPAIWRRVRIPADAPLGALHDLLQLAFGWKNSHLHEFEVNKITFGTMDEESGLLMVDEWATPVGAVAHRGFHFVYRYDPGDAWEHEIKVEDSLPSGDDVFACVDGKRACPPEDCGGAPGYDRMLKILESPKHAEHAEMRQWVGRNFDPEAFSVAATNKRIASHFKRSRRTKKK